MDSGLCPKCIEVEEQPIIKKESPAGKEKVVVKIEPEPSYYPRVNESLGKKVKTKKGVCYVKPCDWLETPSKVSHYEGIKPYKLTKKKIPRTRNWVGTLFKCIVGCKEGVSYWDGGGNEFDKNLNLISTN